MATRLDLSELSLMDALDLATLIEVEARERYVLFADQLGRAGGHDPGSFFATMAENEAKHGYELSVRRKALFGDKPPRVTIDDLFDVEAPDIGSPRRTMSTRQAFEVALKAERKAYAFYDMALPTITNQEVRDLFIELRDEETEHVEMLLEAMKKLGDDADFEGAIDYDESPYL